jgi:pimeloyl-ACP methyl ester carboxylesterase
MAAMPWVPGVEHGYVDVDGLLMHAAEAGEGDPIVLLHGWPRHWYLWRDLIPQLATDRRVICPDLRGFGWTEAPAGGYGKDQLATDRLGVDRFDLVGHDWGAYTGFLIALR